MEPGTTKPTGSGVMKSPPSSLHYLENGVTTENEFTGLLTTLRNDIANGKIAVGGWNSGELATVGKYFLKVIECTYGDNTGRTHSFRIGVEIPEGNSEGILGG